MNLVGKILTVLIFVMAIMFLAMGFMVYAAHKNWREEIYRTTATADKPLGFKPRLEQANARNEELKNQLAALEQVLAGERAARRQQLAKLESELQVVSGDLNNLRQAHEALLAEERKAAAGLEVAEKNLAAKIQENSTLRDGVREAIADRDKHFEQFVRLTDRIHQAQGDISRLKERNDQLVNDVAKAKLNLESAGLSMDTQPGVPQVDGVVLAISGDNLVELSIGEDDGIKVGTTVEVFRDKTYLGRLQVLKTAPDRSVATILKDFRKGMIRQGDRVATRIKA